MAANSKGDDGRSAKRPHTAFLEKVEYLYVCVCVYAFEISVLALLFLM